MKFVINLAILALTLGAVAMGVVSVASSGDINVTKLLYVLVLSILGLAVLLMALSCLNTRVATIRTGELLNQHADLFWGESQPIRVTANIPGLSFIPLRPGLGDPLVANVGVTMSLNPTAIISRFGSQYRFRLARTEPWQDEVVLSTAVDAASYNIEVDTQSGIIGRNKFMYEVNRNLIHRIKVSAWLFAALVALAVFGPSIIH